MMMRKRIIHLSVDEFQDPMSLLYQDRPEWFDGKTPVYLRFSDKDRHYYACDEPFGRMSKKKGDMTG